MAPPQAADAFDYNDMISANRLADPQVSPDGRWVVYAVTTTDVAANRRASALYMMDLQHQDAAAVKLSLNDGDANTARWGSDGKLYFLSGKSGTSQVWRAEADGSGAVQVTRCLRRRRGDWRRRPLPAHRARTCSRQPCPPVRRNG